MAAATSNSLCYHLNRLAGTIVNGVPQYDSQGAAQIWVKNNAVTPNVGVAIAGVLNSLYASRNTGNNFGYDVQGVLNALAGTSGLGSSEAASRIVS